MTREVEQDAYARSFSTELAAVDLASTCSPSVRCLQLKRGEFCALVTDTAWNPAYAAAAMGACKALNAEVSLTTFSASEARSLPRRCKRFCAAADLIVYMSAFTLHYRPELKAALDRGARALCVMQLSMCLQR